MALWRTFFDESARAGIVARLRKLNADAPARWGTLDAPRMIVHLTDQMSHCLGDVPVTPHGGFLGLAPIGLISIYLLPWPKGRVVGPPEAFVTQPASWENDVERLTRLVDRFGAQDPTSEWPPHALFGPMTGRAWGVLCHRHFDHHLRQFGV